MMQTELQIHGATSITSKACEGGAARWREITVSDGEREVVLVVFSETSGQTLDVEELA